MAGRVWSVVSLTEHSAVLYIEVDAYETLTLIHVWLFKSHTIFSLLRLYSTLLFTQYSCMFLIYDDVIFKSVQEINAARLLENLKNN